MAIREWQRAYREALVEVEPPRLRKKIAKAEAMIFRGLRALAQSSSRGVEWRAMNDALSHLRLYKLAEPESSGQEWE